MIVFEHNQIILSTTIQNIIMFIPIGVTLSIALKKQPQNNTDFSNLVWFIVID